MHAPAPSITIPQEGQKYPTLKSKTSYGTLVTIDTRSDSPLVSFQQSQTPRQKQIGFWLVFGALCVTTFLSALDTVSRHRNDVVRPHC